MPDGAFDICDIGVDLMFKVCATWLDARWDLWAPCHEDQALRKNQTGGDWETQNIKTAETLNTFVGGQK